MGWAVGSRGTILHTRDGGRSWINSSLSEDLALSSVAFVNSTRGWIVGEFGVIFQTQNGGKNWIKQKSPVEVSFVSGESRNLFALLFPEPENGWAFGLDGVVLKTRGGSPWEVVRQKEKPAALREQIISLLRLHSMAGYGPWASEALSCTPTRTAMTGARPEPKLRV